MNEAQRRQSVVNIMHSWLGRKEADGTHKEIIDIYNKHTGSRFSYADPWCAMAVSAAFIKAGLTDIAPVDASCSAMIKKYKQLGRWEERDNHKAEVADVLFYDWDDNGVGDCTGDPEHVGIVLSVSGNNMTVIEGNIKDSVGTRPMKIDGKYIRGYGLPDYGKKAEKVPAPVKSNTSKAYKVGDTVNFSGDKHYSNSGAVVAAKCAPCAARITNIKANAKHPYHVVGQSVYGWVDAKDIVGVAGETNLTHTVKKGETLWELSEKYLGKSTRYKEIMALNGLTKTLILVGQVLKIPEM